MPIDFSEFPPVSKQAWLEQVSRDLKDKPLESLHWQAAPGLEVSPFVHFDDFPQPFTPLLPTPRSWELCEAVDAADPEAANRQALEALEFGAEALFFQLPETADAAHLRQLLAGIHLDFIGLHFSGPAVGHNPGAILAALQRIAAERNVATTALRGSLNYDPVNQAALFDWRYLSDLLGFAQPAFPGFRIAAVSAEAAVPDVVEELAQLLQNGNLYLQKLVERGIPVSQAAAALHFHTWTGKSYFLEIAKIRAFKILWLNVLRAWKAPVEYPWIAAEFSPAAYTDELYTNMIRATTMAMSAVVGGVDRLTVRPYAAGRAEQATYPPAFGRRIARNVQHLLKMESELDQATDAAAGSYYLEHLTDQLARQAWAEFTRAE